MSTRSIVDAVSKVVAELSEFSPEERQRIMRASLTLLGDETKNAPDDTEREADGVRFPARARMWMKRYGVTADQIDEVFHHDGNEVKVIAAIPGSTKREQVVNAYILSGIAMLLASGESKFDDKAARTLCESGGFFDGTNHMKYMKNKEFVGSRDKGWVLTVPGQERGATLISEIAQ